MKTILKKTTLTKNSLFQFFTFTSLFVFVSAFSPVSLGDSFTQEQEHGQALGQELKTHFVSVFYPEQKTLEVRVGVIGPENAIGDILFVHGFADRLDNHMPLYQSWVEKGFRVISFDLPSHGETKGSYNDLNHFTFKDLSYLLRIVDIHTLENPDRPLLLAGWSMGALLIVRIVQENWSQQLTRKISGVILLAPGISVYKLPWKFGNHKGFVTNKTLTHDPTPPHHSPVKPASPIWSVLSLHFSPYLIFNSWVAQTREYPENLPTLVYVGGDKEDTYAQSANVRSWFKAQSKKPHRDIISFQCPEARHEIDNELDVNGGLEVRRTSAQFAESVVFGQHSTIHRSNESGTTTPHSSTLQGSIQQDSICKAF